MGSSPTTPTMSIKQLIQKDITLRTEDMNEGIIEINVNSKPVLYLQRVNRPDVKSQIQLSKFEFMKPFLLKLM